jgi:ATP adenylyltransferase
MKHFKDPKNPLSHETVKVRERPSFPVKQLLKSGCIIGRVLDFGSGLGVDIEFLKTKNIDITAYDPHYVPEYPQGKFDTILCNYVLNVLLPEEQAHVLMEIAALLQPNGKAYFAVRRDIKKSGFLFNKTYQCNVILPFKSWLTAEHCEIYEYQHYNQILKNADNDCPFCASESDRTLLAETATAYAILDKYPVTNGHTLIIPKRHVANYFDLTTREQTACWLMVNFVKQQLSELYQTNDFNIGINVGEAAGQTVPHVHIHIIPRYAGDVADAVGGVRNVIEGKGRY